MTRKILITITSFILFIGIYSAVSAQSTPGFNPVTTPAGVTPQFQQQQGLTPEEFARRSDTFVREKLIPLISIKKTDDEATRNKKKAFKNCTF
jgi:hypothetical protein